jgi:hypothetical protein
MAQAVKVLAENAWNRFLYCLLMQYLLAVCFPSTFRHCFMQEPAFSAIDQEAGRMHAAQLAAVVLPASPGFSDCTSFRMASH